MSSSGPTAKDSKQRAIADLLDNTTHDIDFYVLLIGAILLALGAIFTDSVPVLIASMIVAPLAYPILTLGLGIVAGSGKLIIRALSMLAASCFIALTISVVATWLFEGERVVDKYISFSDNSYIAVAIALTAGVIAAYGMVRPKVATAITGVAIAVSLMPPLVATGVGFASGSTDVGREALSLFLLNVIGILAASICTFWWFNMGREFKALKQVD